MNIYICMSLVSMERGVQRDRGRKVGGNELDDGFALNT